MAYVEHLNPIEEGEKYIKELQAMGVDTIISYFDGCSGCIPGLTQDYYIFWDSGKKWHLKKINQYTEFQEITGYSPPINFIRNNFKNIESEKLKNNHGELSHYPFDDIRIILNEIDIEYSVSASVYFQNELAKRIILIDKIRSDILNVLPSMWVGINYKKEKRKKDSA